MKPNLFAEKSAVTDAYVTASIRGANKRQWKEIADKARAAIKNIKAAINAVYDAAPKVHGRFEHSQLDRLTKWREEMEAAMLNGERAAIAAIE